MTHRLDPLASRTAVECQWLFAPEAVAAGFDPSFAVDFWDLTNRQDWAACEPCNAACRAATARARSPPPRTPSPSSSALSPSQAAGPVGRSGPPDYVRRFDSMTSRYVLDPHKTLRPSESCCGLVLGTPRLAEPRTPNPVAGPSCYSPLLTGASVRSAHTLPWPGRPGTERAARHPRRDDRRGEAALMARTRRSHDLHEQASAPAGRRGVVVARRPAVPGVRRARRDHECGTSTAPSTSTCTGFGTMIAGHGHPAIIAAVNARVAIGTHFAQPVPDIITVAGELARRWPLLCGASPIPAGGDARRRPPRRAVTGRARIIKVEAAITATTTPCRYRCSRGRGRRPAGAASSGPRARRRRRRHRGTHPCRPVRPPRRRAPSCSITLARSPA